MHFGPPHRPEASEAVLALVSERRPDLVVISGDLTQRAKPEQFRQAREWVDRLEAPSIAVPGNHDVPMYRVWERALAPYAAYRKHFADEMEPVYTDDELYVVGVNSAFNWTTKHGRITGRRLTRLADQLAAAPAGLSKIVVIHHPLIPPPNFGLQKVTYNSHEAADLFSEAGVELVLSGHEHQSYFGFSEDYYTFGRRPYLFLSSGTTCSTRGRRAERGIQSCNWIRMEDDALEVTNLRYESADDRFVERTSHRFARPAK